MKFAFVVVVAAAALAAVCATAAPLTEQQYEHLFTRFVQHYGKEYKTNGFFSKYNTFKANLNKIMAHNAKDGETYKMAMNDFGDLNAEEFAARLGLRPVLRSFGAKRDVANFAGADVPGSIDWREKNAVSEVKNQRHCKSCWAFSATAAVEGAIAISTGSLYSLSEGQLMNCGQSYGNGGCNAGGLMDPAFDYVIDHGGLCETKDYPYEDHDQPCQADRCTPPATIKGYKDVAKNEKALTAAVATSVVSVGIDASTSFQFYASGVFNGPCSSTKLNHGVAIVGYNTEDATPYYIVRNSWGSGWGEGGYIRMAHGKNTCGITLVASYVVA